MSTIVAWRNQPPHTEHKSRCWRARKAWGTSPSSVPAAWSSRWGLIAAWQVQPRLPGMLAGHPGTGQKTRSGERWPGGGEHSRPELPEASTAMGCLSPPSGVPGDGGPGLDASPTRQPAKPQHRRSRCTRRWGGRRGTHAARCRRHEGVGSARPHMASGAGQVAQATRSTGVSRFRRWRLAGPGSWDSSPGARCLSASGVKEGQRSPAEGRPRSASNATRWVSPSQEAPGEGAMAGRCREMRAGRGSAPEVRRRGAHDTTCQHFPAATQKSCRRCRQAEGAHQRSEDMGPATPPAGTTLQLQSHGGAWAY